MTITGAPATTPAVPTAPGRRRAWLLLLLVWPGLVLLSVAQDTWAGLDVSQAPFHGLDTHARDLAGQTWAAEPTGVDATDYRVTSLAPGDTVKTWSDVSQNGHFGIATRIDSVVDPAGPVDLVEVSATRDSMGRTFPRGGSPVGERSSLPTTLSPGAVQDLNLTWSLSTCAPPGAGPRTFSVSSVALNETVLGWHRTRTFPLGFTLSLTEPRCSDA